MNVLFVVHMWPPKHNAGGEYFASTIAEYLISKGHEVRVFLWQGNYDEHKEAVYHYNGMNVYSTETPNAAIDLISWSTHIITHLENTPWTLHMAAMFKKHVFFLSHNTWNYPCVNQRNKAEWPDYPIGVIYNSHWMAEKLQYPQRSIVLHPPIDKSKVDPENQPWYGDRITIVNSNERKGGEIFKRLVAYFTQRKFLLILGAYDEQVVPQKPNVLVYRGTPDILPLYKQTRILLAPSAYESWGMAVSEAMANGIPVITSATPGLKENASYAGRFVNSERMQQWMDLHNPPSDMQDIKAVSEWIEQDKTKAMDILTDDDLQMWIDEIKRLDDQNVYFAQSELCRQRGKELIENNELEKVEKFLNDTGN